jgi:ribulose-5-phosphate 4-epimerase/fuculose-1-phosphate aldolase
MLTKSVRGLVSEQEWQARVNLAALYRLMAGFGWDDHIFTHLSARVPGEPGHMLLNPLGLMFREVTASSLVKVTHDGTPVMDSPYGIHWGAAIIHSAVYASQEKAAYALHLHTPHGQAVSALKEGLLPLTQQSMMLFGRVAYHDYEGLALEENECTRLARDLDGKKLMILRNHGTLTWGESAGEAFLLAYQLERSCVTQIAILSTRADIHMPPRETIEYTAHQEEQPGMIEHSWAAALRKLEVSDSDYRS